MDLNLNIFLKQGDFTLDAHLHLKDDVVGLFGPSGAGKSTLLHLLSGLRKPQNGHIILKKRTLCDVTNGIFVPPEKRGIGVVFQDARLFPHMNVEKNILFGIKKGGDRDFLKSVLRVLKIGHLLKREPSHLSSGERQRVAIARALVRKPHLMLLDEPFSAIDVHLRASLLPFISHLQKEFRCPMLIISHYLPDLLCLTNSLVLMDEGKILGHGDCSDLAFDPHCVRMIKHAGIYATFDTEVSAVHKENGMVFLNAGGKAGQAVKAPYKEGVVKGMAVKARLRPEDVVLAKGPSESITSQNQIKAKVLRMRDFQDEVLLEMEAGFRILCGVTRTAASKFSIAPGKEIWICFKTVAVEYFPSS